MSSLTSVNPSFGVNSFNQPKVYSAEESLVRDLLFILFAKPGCMPSMPTYGMHIQDYLYSLEGTIDATRIKAKIAQHCQLFYPLIQSGDIDVVIIREEGNPMLIFRLPAITKLKHNGLYVGVRVLENGEMQFQFQFEDRDQEI